MISRSTLPLTVAPLTPDEFEDVWLRLLAAGAGHAGRFFTDLFTEDEIEKVLGHEIVERLKATVLLFKAAAAEAPRN